MFLIIAISLLCANFANGGILYPKNSETREVVTLDGIWRFAVANKSAQNQGFEEKWFTQPLHKVGIKYSHVEEHKLMTCF